MLYQSSVHWFRRPALIAIAGLLGCQAPIAHADTIEVKNKQLKGTVTLSDLIVYNAAGDSETILATGDATDDVEIEAGKTKRFTTKELDGAVVSYEISITTAKGEHEWDKRGREVRIIVPEPVTYFDEAGGDRPVHCAIDPGAPNPVLEPGEVYFIENGGTPELPGLFFGLTYDVKAGEIVDPFTGQVQVREEQFDVLIEPDAACYADCDASGDLDVFDFLCFQNAFAAGEAYADCDASGDLDIFDFLCFQNAMTTGCP
ncbi:MAG: hypothetical protein ACF8R7_17805 [Phycisphaerales bacterium JB039]